MIYIRLLYILCVYCIDIELYFIGSRDLDRERNLLSVNFFLYAEIIGLNQIQNKTYKILCI